jgi:inner membrane protein involved in colicin E2 resistance
MAWLKLDRKNCEHCKFIGSIFPTPANCTDLEFLRMSSIFWYLHNYDDSVRECNQIEREKANELSPHVSKSVCEHHITNKGICAACGESDMSQNDCY